MFNFDTSFIWSKPKLIKILHEWNWTCDWEQSSYLRLHKKNYEVSDHTFRMRFVTELTDRKGYKNLDIFVYSILFDLRRA